MSEPIRSQRNDAIPLGYESPNPVRPIMRRQTVVRVVVTLVIIVAVLFIGVLLLLPQLGKARATAQELQCASNLKYIGLECQIYSNNHNGRFPATFEELLRTTDLTSDVFVCPETNDVQAPGSTAAAQGANLSTGHHLSYVYVGNGVTSSIPNPSTVVVAYEPLSNHHGVGSNFLFADGHVLWIEGQAAKLLIAVHPATQSAKAPLNE